jgi:DNA adenine methylase
MAYLGGKATSAQHILKILNHPVFNNMIYIEPFCGYCHILRRVENKRKYIASDSNDLLVTLLKHVQKTKEEHPRISQEEYKILRVNPSIDPLRAAYAAFTYSYNGKYFAGFVGNNNSGITRSYPSERKRYYNKLHDNQIFQKTSLKHLRYDAYSPEKIQHCLIYCDPPYADTEGYRNVFDSEEFWNWVRKMTAKNNYVFVSEYKAPADFVCISQLTKRQTISVKAPSLKEEKVFIHESLLSDPVIQKVVDDANKEYPCSVGTSGSSKNKTRKRNKN